LKDRPGIGVANAASGTAKVSLDAVEDELRSGPPVDDRRLLDVVCCLKSEVSDSPLQLGIDRILNACWKRRMQRRRILTPTWSTRRTNWQAVSLVFELERRPWRTAMSACPRKTCSQKSTEGRNVKFK
jgi:hypothetical protein